MGAVHAVLELDVPSHDGVSTDHEVKRRNEAQGCRSGAVILRSEGAYPMLAFGFARPKTAQNST